MTDSLPLIFYDISSPIEPRSYAPNPSKARLALSFKGVPFKTTWVDILDISDVRKGLSCPATRKFDDGSDFYTLPMLRDPASGRVVGDSFDIANYLEDMFPDSGGCLFPPDSTRTGLDYESPNKDTAFFAPLTSNLGSKNEAYARFNTHVDATFSAHVVLVAQYLPFNPNTAEAVRALFVKRAHLRSWDDICATYADLIVGGWLNMLSATMPEEEWKDFRTWHSGVFARLHDALQENYFECK
ncbi:glutathione S-transferase family protein, putative [Acanthamoeba castellanii str. Neff]|uniref:Glutathione S-transferase family protein, putative n=1 Tax=Acanthamoeba castellanii (strain ATCC 30010 / Neff) TaxID=1257118 RepID=L8GEN5_ACACF|nr:glutathione S-transferase family protein, putative [Acanthamoeba castellanii str. Neff]ELR11339.1 glutathione S-transferase family protein, putative [Acanthamoeba castellanii str. Neff]